MKRGFDFQEKSLPVKNPGFEPVGILPPKKEDNSDLCTSFLSFYSYIEDILIIVTYQWPERPVSDTPLEAREKCM